ncbi:acyltransferase family protein [Mesobacillus zeae]|uniref:Acetyltransferase n=1 Tax=Mesobacillus zeae TaxID=1917180 RepID=A0A398BD20_9BACI|nr:acyltransferase family protein [Mesobacillus zeae]RID86718.1 acetyltransferase [Mesobacillus zeae]
MKGQTHKTRYIAGLDGLRALAVLSVIAYHFNFSWASGGFLGVDIFFVLSGYLITSLILPDHDHPFEFSLKKFWIGRIRRLLPAAYVMIMSTFVWVVLFHRELLTTVRGDTIASIFYGSNWWFIFHKLSYFDSMGSPSPIKNLWSLAIEEQFYLVWPLVVLAGLHILKKRSRFSTFVLAGAFCSALLMAVLYEPGSDPSRVYYGTDTRSFELLIGCWLALVWPMKRLSTKKVSANLKNKLNITSAISFGIFILCVVFVDEYQTFLYWGGMLLVCLNAAVLIACVCHPSSSLGQLLSWKPLRWIGTRSYGIYLWHYPVIVLGTPVYEIGQPVYWRVALQLIITFGIAEISYRFIEMPIRKHGLLPFLRQLHPSLKWSSASFTRRAATVSLTMVLLVFTAGITGVVKGEGNGREESPTIIKINNSEKPAAREGSGKDAPEKQGIHPAEKEKQDKKPEQKQESNMEQKSESNLEVSESEKEEAAPPPEKIMNKEILAIGDSVMLDAAPSLLKRFPNITIDAKVGRQVSQAIQLAPSYAAFNHPDKAVIIQLGTNGFFTEDQIDTLLDSFSNADIYLVNARVPRPWERKVNESLKEIAKEHEHITLVDWHGTGINHPEYFGSDGVHLGHKGAEALTDLITQTIKENKPNADIY